MKLVNLSTKDFEDIPDDKVQEAFSSGTHGFASPDDRVPVKAPDGSLGSVDAKDAAAAFAAGASVAPAEEYRSAELEGKYGGLGGTLAAGAEGFARGLTVGTSDPIAIEAAKAFGGPEAEQKIRTHLAEEKEAHPYLSTATEIGGAALPTVLSGGATAPEEAAALAARGGVEAAEGGSRMATLLRAVGAPARGAAKAGELAGGASEWAMGKVLGSPSAEGAMARITRMAVKSGATGAGEGAVFGAGSQISEDALGDHELNAEKMAAAIGHGALWGGMTGTALGASIGAAKETFGSVLHKTAPYLERQADLQAARSADPKLQILKKAAKYGVSAEDLGATARKFDIVPSSPIEAAKMDAQAYVDKTKAAMDEVGGNIDTIISGSSATVKASAALKLLDDRAADLEKTAAGKSVARTIREFRNDFAQSIVKYDYPTGEVPGAEEPIKPAARIKRTPQEIQDFLAANPKGNHFSPAGKLSNEATYKPAGPEHVGSPHASDSMPGVLPSGRKMTDVESILGDRPKVSTESIFSRRVYKDDIPVDDLPKEADLKGATTEPVRLGSLIATQENLESNGVNLYRAGKEAGGGKHGTSYGETPTVLRVGDEDYLLEGHHRAAAAMMRGEQTMQAQVLRMPREGAAPQVAAKPLGPVPSAGAAPHDPDVPVAQLVAERRALQTRLFEDQKSLAPKWPVQEMREFTGELGKLIQKSIDDAPHTLGEGQGQALKAANKDYQRLTYLAEAYDRRLAAHTALRAVSPTSYLAGGAVAAGSMAVGHPLGALKGVAVALGHTAMLSRGNAVASAALGKIAKLDLIARAAEKVDTEMETAVQKFVTSGERASAPRIRLRHFASAPQTDLQQRYDEAQRETPRAPQPTLGLDHVDKAIPGLAQHAPKTALALASVVAKGSQYIQAQTPQAQADPGLLGKPPRPSDQAASANLRIRGAIEDPVGTLKRGLETGKLAQDELEAVKSSKPKLFAQFQRTLTQAVAEHKDKMTYDKVATISKILGIALDPSLRPERVAALQQTFAGQPMSPQQGHGGAPRGAPKRQLKGLASFATLSTGDVNATPQ